VSLTTHDYALFATHSYEAVRGQQDAAGATSFFNNAKILATSDKSDKDEAGFFAVAYQIVNEVVIAYEGTNFGFNIEGWKDVRNGWIGAAGVWQSSQSEQALEFYNKVDGLTNLPITTTGHSLGGGLAGLVASLKGTKAVIFDNMPFELAEQFASVAGDAVQQILSSGMTLEQAEEQAGDVLKEVLNTALNLIYAFKPILSFTKNGMTIIIDEVTELVEFKDLRLAQDYQIANSTIRDQANINGAAIEGEILEYIRPFQKTNVDNYDGLFGGSERPDYGLVQYIPIISNVSAIFGNVFESIARHSMDHLSAHIYLEETSIINSADVSFLGAFLTSSLYDDEIAGSLGFDKALQMYRAISLGTASGGGTPYGVNSLNALLNDAANVGAVLDGAEYNLNARLNWTPDDALIRVAFSDQITQFAAGLSQNINEPTGMDEGFIRSTIHGSTDVLTIDYSQALWGKAFGSTNFPTSSIIGRSGQSSVLDILDFDRFMPGGFLLNSTEWGALNLYGSHSVDRFERIHYFKEDNLSSGVNIDLEMIDGSYLADGNKYTSPISRFDFISGTEFNDSIVGSDRNEIIEGGDGSDTLLGGAGNDLLVASSGNGDVDYLNGGAGDDWAVFSRDLNDYQITVLDAGHEYDFLVKELSSFSKIPFTSPSFTGNEVYIKDIQFGVFDGGKTYQFGKDGPFETAQENLLAANGSQVGVISIEAPTYALGTNIEFSLNLSTSGVGTQYRVALIIDVSGSMGGSRIVEAKAAYVDLINYLKDQGIADVTEFAVIPFESSATLYEGLSADEAIARINSLSTGGGTEFGSAISRGLEFFDGAQAGLTQIAYFLSDGQGSGASADLQVVAEVRAFGISSGASISSLNTIDSNNAVILNSASDLAASFTESEIKTADVDKIEVYLNGVLTQTITGDQLTDNGATGLTFSGTISGLDTFNADTLEAKVFFKDTSIPAQSVAFEVGDGTTEATSTDGDDRIVFSMSQQSVDAGGGIDNVFANDLDNNLIKLDGGGVIRLYGGNDNANLSGAGPTLQSPTPAPFALSRLIEPSVVSFSLSTTASASSRTNIILDGGTGTDTVTYTGIFADHTVQRAGGLVTVSWGTSVTDSLSNAEFLQFDDVKVRTSDLSVVQTLSASSVEIVESDGNTQMTITVKLDAASANDVTFDYATKNGTAEEGRDFVAAIGSITLFAGETQKTITIDVTGDTVFEGDETFELQLSNANGAVFDGSNGTYSITGIIKNDDDANQVETGSAGDDVINTGKGNDQINSGAGNDIVNANLGNDLVIDGLGNNSLNGEGGADTIIALSGLNTLTGGDGSDYLAGGFQADNLNGGAGNDVLRGDAGGFLGGSDILVGGADDDFLMGGRGADTFVFNTNGGSDVIAAFDVADIGFGTLSGYTATATGADFQSGVDHIQLAGFSTVDVSNVMSWVTDGADGAVFSAEGTSITFYDVAANQLTTDDFIIV
jgi:Ca2+-binding RTX toxin-like protein